MLHGFNRDQPFFSRIALAAKGDHSNFSERRELIQYRARKTANRTSLTQSIQPSAAHGSLNEANGSDPSTQSYAVASMEGSEPDWH